MCGPIHFYRTEYKTKLQRGQVICPRSYNHWKIKLWPALKTKFHAFPHDISDHCSSSLSSSNCSLINTTITLLPGAVMFSHFEGCSSVHDLSASVDVMGAALTHRYQEETVLKQNTGAICLNSPVFTNCVSKSPSYFLAQEICLWEWCCPSWGFMGNNQTFQISLSDRFGPYRKRTKTTKAIYVGGKCESVCSLIKRWKNTGP